MRSIGATSNPLLLFFFVGFIMMAAAVEGTRAASPDLQTPPPVIYLADNLDEQDRLGWCIDTVGRGFSDRLHAHSCKPGNRRHGDVQFRYNTDTRQIMSATYDGKCAELLGDPAVGGKLALLDCAANSGRQTFDFDTAKGEFRVGGDQSLCLAVAPTSRTAGPFMSRDLVLARCEAADEKYKRWVIKGGA